MATDSYTTTWDVTLVIEAEEFSRLCFQRRLALVHLLRDICSRVLADLVQQFHEL